MDGCKEQVQESLFEKHIPHIENTKDTGQVHQIQSDTS